MQTDSVIIAAEMNTMSSAAAIPMWHCPELNCMRQTRTTGPKMYWR